MEVFWRKGYDAASLSDLTTAMGINPPSLYGTFGNKEELFVRVLEKYAVGPASYVLAALAAPSSREVARRRLLGAVQAMTDSRRPGGCLAVQALARTGDAQGPIGQMLVTFCDGAHQAYVARLRRARDEGDLPPEADPVALARYLNVVAQGISLQAASGASREELLRVAELALSQWPGR